MLPEFLLNPNPDIYLEGGAFLTLDFEVDTSHGDYGHPVYPDNGMLLACWKWPGGPTHCVRGDEYTIAERIIPHVMAAKVIVAHNAKYELGWLLRMGVDLRKLLVFDTQIAEYVLLGNLAAPSEYGVPQHSVSLDMSCRRRGLPIKDPVVDIMIGNKINPVRIPASWLEGRCRQDVVTTEQVFLMQRQELKERGLLPVQYTRCLLTPVLAAIEQEGMALDPERVEETYAEYQTRYIALDRQMQELTGGLNWRSPKQVAAYLYDTLKFAELPGRGGKACRTPGGGRCTDRKVLERLVATTPEQQAFLDLRRAIGKVAAALSKALEFYVGVVREKGGTFYAELNQTNTATHRLSSTGAPIKFELFEDAKSAQFQNQPRIFKRLFRAKRAGWLIADPDGSSLEFRVAAALAGPDPAALADIESGWDVHAFTASMLNDKPLSEIVADSELASLEKRDSLRQAAKPDTFKPLYGGTRGTPAQERYYAAFRKRYPGIAKTQDDWAKEVINTKRLVTPWGLIYYWPTATANRRGRLNVMSQVYNYPIQTLATAEIIPIAVVFLWHRIGAEGLDDVIKLVNLVHDNAPSEIHPSAADAYVVLAKQAFTHDVYRYLQQVYGLDFRVPLGIGLKIGEHWGEGKEMQFNVWKDGREKRVK